MSKTMRASSASGRPQSLDLHVIAQHQLLGVRMQVDPLARQRPIRAPDAGSGPRAPGKGLAEAAATSGGAASAGIALWRTAVDVAAPGGSPR
jgi:hypothetical protein